MSAFLVSDAHIDALVYASTVVRLWGRAQVGDELGRMLLRENMRSLAARYSDDVDEERLASYCYMRPDRKPTIVELLKAIDCYKYQSCEHDGWEASAAREYCTQVVQALVCELPGWKDAPWGIERNTFGASKETRIA